MFVVPFLGLNLLGGQEAVVVCQLQWRRRFEGAQLYDIVFT